MWDLIKLWLLIRALEYQEEFIIANSGSDYVAEYEKGSSLLTDSRTFVLRMTHASLLWAFLPKRFQYHLRPFTKEEGNGPVQVSKIRKLNALVALAKSKEYVEGPPAEFTSVEVGSKKPRKAQDPIRVSAKGDHFSTIAGGIEELLRTFPKLWTLVGLSLVPWIATNHQAILKFIGHLV